MKRACDTKTLSYTRKKTCGLETTIRNRIKISRYIVRYFQVFDTYRYHYRENVWNEYLVTDTMRYRYNKGKETGTKENRKTQQKQS